MMELEKCPFCGGEGTVKSFVQTTKNGKNFMRGWVGCKKCGVYMDWTFEPSGTIRKWNRRVKNGD